MKEHLMFWLSRELLNLGIAVAFFALWFAGIYISHFINKLRGRE